MEVHQCLRDDVLMTCYLDGLDQGRIRRPSYDMLTRRLSVKRHESQLSQIPPEPDELLVGVVTSQRRTGGLYVLQEIGSRADPQDMTNNDEPIYETVKREHNWDPERGEPLSLTTLSVGRHVG